MGRHVDFLVAGGGAAGLAVAESLAKKGYRVVLAEARPWLGGMAAYLGVKLPNGLYMDEYARNQVRRVLDAGVEVRTWTSVEYCGYREVCLRSLRGVERLTPGTLVVATGVAETPWAWLGVEADPRSYGLIPASSFLSVLGQGYTLGERIIVYGCDVHALASSLIAASLYGSSVLVYNCHLPLGLVEALEDKGVKPVRGIVVRATGFPRLRETLIRTRDGELVLRSDTLVYSFTRPSLVAESLARLRLRKILVGGALTGGEDITVHSKVSVKIVEDAVEKGVEPGLNPRSRCVSKAYRLVSSAVVTGSCSPFQLFSCGPHLARSWAWNSVIESCRGIVSGRPVEEYPRTVLDARLAGALDVLTIEKRD